MTEDTRRGEMAVDERFLGTWSLVGVDREEVATGAKLDADVVQTGYISYTRDGRVMVIISRANPKRPAPEIMCYAAAWTVDGDKVYHDVDIAARQEWSGTRQTRHFRFHDDMLTLSPPVSADFMHGTVTRRSLTWRRIV
jgi:hypothetical protein